MIPFYNLPKIPEKIDFDQVEQSFDKILDEAYFNSDKKVSKQIFVDNLAIEFINKNTRPYIADLQIQIPHTYIENNHDWKIFYNDFSFIICSYWNNYFTTL